jgi:peptidoglycan/xylan/chitin deacetylase (PgdA/CDA1 family)
MHAPEENRRQEHETAEPRGSAAPGKLLHLLYHELTTDPPSNTYQLHIESFRSHLCELLGHQAGLIRPVVTFDDGHRSNYEAALPALNEFRVSGIFFITAGWVSDTRGQSVSWSDLRALQEAGHVIGAHGWSHKLFTHCNPTELRREIVTAKAALEDNLGSAVTSLSFPGGRSNQRCIQTALEAGYTTLYTSTPAVEALPLCTLVGRVNVRSDWSSSYLGELLKEDQRALNRLRRQSVLKDAAKNILGDRLYSRLWTAVNGKQVEADSFRGAGT